MLREALVIFVFRGPGTRLDALDPRHDLDMTLLDVVSALNHHHNDLQQSVLVQSEVYVV